MLVLWIAAGLAAVYLAGAYAVFSAVFRRRSALDRLVRRFVRASDDKLAPYRAALDEARTFFQTHAAEDVSIVSADGLTLRAGLYAHPDARAVMVACHGYRSSGERDFSCAVRFYYELGLSVLLIDERAAGRSEGTYITFGARESDDARRWCVYIQERFPALPILLAGVSMGASTVLTASPDLPPNVAALLADCGYADAWRELAWAGRRGAGAATALLLPGVALWCRLLAGFDLRRTSAEKALRENHLPVFFAHGEADALVPYENALQNRAACAAPSVLLSVPGAGHGMSYLVDTPGYQAAVTAFLRRHVPALRDISHIAG